MTGRCLALLVAAGAAVWSVAAEAQPYPARPITIVVPYAAGGVFDTMARIIGARMGELLGQSVIVENVTGAGGIIGVQHVINAKPDGYTVLLGSVGTHAYNQSIYRKRRYDAVSDFTPVTLFSDSQMVLEGRKDLPANNLAEFIALLKQNGRKMQYGYFHNGLLAVLANPDDMPVLDASRDITFSCHAANMCARRPFSSVKLRHAASKSARACSKVSAVPS
jgi:tripartite-type tricarboxylate transporter receptor subunit TctC